MPWWMFENGYVSLLIFRCWISRLLNSRAASFCRALFSCLSTCDRHAIQRLETIESRPSYFLICFWCWFVICYVASSAASFLKITKRKMCNISISDLLSKLSSRFISYALKTSFTVNLKLQSLCFSPSAHKAWVFFVHTDQLNRYNDTYLLWFITYFIQE